MAKKTLLFRSNFKLKNISLQPEKTIVSTDLRTSFDIAIILINKNFYNG